jgi:hypothetical protein
VADGQVALHGEGRDGEHGGVGRRLGEHPSQEAKGAAEDVGVARVNQVDLLGDAREEQHQVRDGQAEEVVVGGGVHRLVPGDDDAGADVAHGAGYEDDDVGGDDGHHDVEAVPLRAHHLLGALHRRVLQEHWGGGGDALTDRTLSARGNFAEVCRTSQEWRARFELSCWCCSTRAGHRTGAEKTVYLVHSRARVHARCHWMGPPRSASTKRCIFANLGFFLKQTQPKLKFYTSHANWKKIQIAFAPGKRQLSLLFRSTIRQNEQDVYVQGDSKKNSLSFSFSLFL